jgi:Ribonuclease G/E
MTRKRVKQGLIRSISQACPTCAGTGAIRALPSIANQILREVEWQLYRRKPPQVRIRAHPDVTAWLKAEEAEVIEALQQQYGGEITLGAEDSWQLTKYQVQEV